MASIKHWLLATRPKTLPAGTVPVVLGSSIAFCDGKLNILIAVLCLLCSAFMQIIANFVNEIYDFKRGADTKERTGPQRMVASGIISAKEMSVGAIVLGIITVILGGIIILNSGIWILITGVVALIFAWLYTGGPYPLAYHGLGDICVLIFFGLVAVNGTYYAQTLELSPICLLASFAPGFLSMNILGINNFRDIDTDKKAGKFTLSTKLGRENCIFLYRSLMMLAFIVPVVLYVIKSSVMFLFPLALIPFGLKLINDMKTKNGTALNSVLAGTGQMVFFHGILSSLGFILLKIL